MKITIYKSIFFSLLCAGMVSCKKDFLHLVPQGEQVAVTTNDYSLLMNDANLSQYTFAGGWQGEVIIGDEVAAESSKFSVANLPTQSAFRWDDQIFQIADIDWSTRLWLEKLYQINKVINEVSQSSGGTDQQKKEVLAEAQASRAWVYFQLINFYGKPYVASTAGTDPGFPIILTADITTAKFTRNTVQEVYDFIIKDFTAAIPNLPVNSLNGIHFNKAAAEGLLGKVYLYMGKNTDALAQFNLCFNDNAARSVPAHLYNYNTAFAPGGIFTPMTDNGPNNSPGFNYNDFTESIVSKSFYNYTYNGNGFGNDAFVLDPKAAALFGSSDLRLKFYAAQFPNNVPNPSGRLRKFGVEFTQFGLQLPELYLLSAEVKARLNDLAGAKTDVETLRKNRMPEADATVPVFAAGSQAALIRFIFDERLREFAMEGYRWFDMRRNSVDPIFSGQTYTHTLYNNADNTTTTYTLRPVRLTLKLPLSITSVNPDMVNNP